MLMNKNNFWKKCFFLHLPRDLLTDVLGILQCSTNVSVFCMNNSRVITYCVTPGLRNVVISGTNQLITTPTICCLKAQSSPQLQRTESSPARFIPNCNSWRWNTHQRNIRVNRSRVEDRSVVNDKRNESIRPRLHECTIRYSPAIGMWCPP